jgi:tetratricopeptide (TPR) repeat protein
MEQAAQGNMFDDIAALERHLSAHPASPLFARLASLYIDKDRPAQALKLCLQGIRLHPDYPTGLLMIARAQIMLRQYGDARQTLRALLRILPFCPAALRLCERMKELELEYPPYAAAAGSVVAQQKITRETERDPRLQWSHQDDILPGIEKFSRGRTVPAPVEETAPETAPPAFDLGALAQRLEGARIPSLPEEDERSESAGGDGDVEEINLDLRPITETLISIYEQQGRWREALDGYRRLARLQPRRREYFEGKVRELEQRLAKEQSPEP